MDDYSMGQQYEDEGLIADIGNPATHPATQPNGECADPGCECHWLATADVRELPRLQPTPRTFADCLNEWTDTVVELNRTATPEQVALILRLGTLGQRLLYEANTLGINEALRMVRERMEGR
jgi:hypothetical protein